MLVLFSYSPNGARNTSCSCHPRYDEWESYFEITIHHTEEELINEVFRQYQEDKESRRSFEHLVFSGDATFTQLKEASMRIFDGNYIENSIDVFAKENTEESYAEATKTQERLRQMLADKMKLHKSKK